MMGGAAPIVQPGSDGPFLADAIDQAFAANVHAEVRAWLADLEKEGLSELPPAEGLARWFIDRSWEWFSPALSRVVFPPKTFRDLNLSRRVELMLKLLDNKMPELFGRAALPIVEALHSGGMSAIGLPLPEREHAWRSDMIPDGYWQPNLWVLYRNGSRLQDLDRNGTELPSGFGSVRLLLVHQTIEHDRPHSGQPLAAHLAARRGPKTKRREQITAAMVDDVVSGRRTLADLRDEKEEALVATYGSSRYTVRKARDAALSEIVGNSPARISDN